VPIPNVREDNVQSYCGYTAYYNEFFVNIKYCLPGYEASDLSYNRNALNKQKVQGGLCFKDRKSAYQYCNERGYTKDIGSSCVSNIKTPKDLCIDRGGMWVPASIGNTAWPGYSRPDNFADDPYNEDNWKGKCFNPRNVLNAEQILCPAGGYGGQCFTPQPPPPPPKPKPTVDLLLLEKEEIEGVTGGVVQKGGGEGQVPKPIIDIEIGEFQQ